MNTVLIVMPWDANGPLIPDYSLSNAATERLILPGASVNRVGERVYTGDMNRDLHAHELATFLLPPGHADSLRFFFYGRIIYDDVFGIRHERGFGRRIFVRNDRSFMEFVSGKENIEYYKRYDTRKNEHMPELEI